MPSTSLQKSLPTIGNARSKKNLAMKKPGEKQDVTTLVAKTKAAAPIRERARALLENPAYLKNLQKRLIAGEAGALEIWLYRYGYGEPKADRGEEEEQKQEFERIRAEVQKVIKEGGKEGKILDISIQRSSRKLTRLAHPEDDDAGT